MAKPRNTEKLDSENIPSDILEPTEIEALELPEELPEGNAEAPEIIDEEIIKEKVYPTKIKALRFFSFGLKMAANSFVTLSCKENDIIKDPHLIKVYVDNQMPVIEVE